MPATLDKLCATPKLLKYQFNNDTDAHAEAKKLAAELIADCEPGPLKALLELAAVAGPPMWDRLMYTSFLSIYTLVIANSGADPTGTTGPPISAKLDDGVSPDEMFLTVKSDGRGQGWAPGQAGIVELRFNE